MHIDSFGFPILKRKTVETGDDGEMRNNLLTKFRNLRGPDLEFRVFQQSILSLLFFLPVNAQLNTYTYTHTHTQIINNHHQHRGKKKQLPKPWPGQKKVVTEYPMPGKEGNYYFPREYKSFLSYHTLKMDLCSNISGNSGQIYDDIKFIEFTKKFSFLFVIHRTYLTQPGKISLTLTNCLPEANACINWQIFPAMDCNYFLNFEEQIKWLHKDLNIIIHKFFC